METNILERFGWELVTAAVTECCSLVDPCDFHKGFIVGVDRIIDKIESELAKVGYGT